MVGDAGTSLRSEPRRSGNSICNRVSLTNCGLDFICQVPGRTPEPDHPLRTLPRPQPDIQQAKDAVGTHETPHRGRGPETRIGTREPHEHRIGGRHAKRSGRWRLPSGQFEPAPASLSASPTHSPFEPLTPHSGGSLRGPAAQWLRQVRATARGHQVSREVGAMGRPGSTATSRCQRTCPPPSLIGCASGNTPSRALIDNW